MSVFNEVYEEFLFERIDNSDFLTGFVIGHLVIEHLLEEIVVCYNPKLKEHFAGLVHSRKISFLQSLEIFPEGVAHCLQCINKMRNKFAHQLGYEPNKGELLTLIRLCRENFNDLTDGLEQLHGGLESSNSLKEANDKYGCGLEDLFIQIAYDLEHYAGKYD